MTESNTQQNAPMKFEDAMRGLETIVAQLEAGTLSLEESLAKFEEGMRLSQICRDKLTQAQGRIEQLVPRPNGAYGTEPFTPPQNSGNPPF